jgi:hypothetical protein
MLRRYDSERCGRLSYHQMYTCVLRGQLQSVVKEEGIPPPAGRQGPGRKRYQVVSKVSYWMRCIVICVWI